MEAKASEVTNSNKRGLNGCSDGAGFESRMVVMSRNVMKVAMSAAELKRCILKEGIG
jgi:hypothetical protein